MTDSTYNGWTNYETWAVALWIDNDHGSYNYWRERSNELLEGDNRPIGSMLTWEESVCYELAEELEGEIKDGAPEVNGMYADLLSAALSEVNWSEIAHNILSESDEYTGRLVSR